MVSRIVAPGLTSRKGKSADYLLLMYSANSQVCSLAIAVTSRIFSRTTEGDVFLILDKEYLYEKGRRHYAKRCRQQAAKAPCGTSIEKRPEEIRHRRSFEHWERDSVMGCKGSKKTLLVLTERLTRMGIVILVENPRTTSAAKAINRLERRFVNGKSHVNARPARRCQEATPPPLAKHSRLIKR